MSHRVSADSVASVLQVMAPIRIELSCRNAIPLVPHANIACSMFLNWETLVEISGRFDLQPF